MSEAKFTKGPWKVAGKGLEARIDCSVGTIVGRIGWMPDARLIAAAPDLYEALENLIGSWDADISDTLDLDCTVARARAALAKARGE